MKIYNINNSQKLNNIHFSILLSTHLNEMRVFDVSSQEFGFLDNLISSSSTFSRLCIRVHSVIILGRLKRGSALM